MEIGDAVIVQEDDEKYNGTIVDIDTETERDNNRLLYLVDVPQMKTRRAFTDWMKKRMMNRGKNLTTKTVYYSEKEIKLFEGRE